MTAAPAIPIARPTDISTANSRTTTQNVESAWVANSSIPIMSAIPTGSLTPDSPSRIVPVRPLTSRLPSTENITAGSVGRQRGAEDTGARPAEAEQVAAGQGHQARGRKRPQHPQMEIGTTPAGSVSSRRAYRRQRGSRRGRATATRSTSWIESSRPSRGTKCAVERGGRSGRSPARAPGIRSLSLLASTASAKTPDTTRTIRPKSVSSCTAFEPRASGCRRCLELGCQCAVCGLGGGLGGATGSGKALVFGGRCEVDLDQPARRLRRARRETGRRRRVGACGAVGALGRLGREQRQCPPRTRRSRGAPRRPSRAPAQGPSPAARARSTRSRRLARPAGREQAAGRAARSPVPGPPPTRSSPPSAWRSWRRALRRGRRRPRRPSPTRAPPRPRRSPRRARAQATVRSSA